MNASPVDPSSAAAKEPDAKPVACSKYITMTDRAVIIVGKQYNLSEIEAVSTPAGKWQEVVSLSCLVAALGFYAFARSRGYHLHLPWMPEGNFTPVYAIFGLLFIVFGAWSYAASRLVFKLPTGNSVVYQGDRSTLKKIKAEVDRARIAAAPAGPPDSSNRPG